MNFKFKPGTFYLIKHDKLAAEVTFTVNEKIISINHTLVDKSLRGQGIARKLMLQIISYAQENNYLINPVCSYSVKFFEHTDKYNDLLV
ncbi:N-acetyltransferase [Apilactobacillus apisilvae]|uniref:N-acetyltransferase n=1 Tax=Apilactobacillus apisilvae TaxID=2923364 RepID=A0ABY4PGU8_9LACO|nr:GNAT family N-acetyltransferase [Apilactobacillus apisilvae]UQS84718.1 N-acetyltransferase [Apilactobacillus apisilvae]